MPKKKAGFLYEVHPTPAKGSDGRNIVYARPARGMKLSIDAVDDYCARHHCLRSGELKLAMGEFLKAAGALMARGYRIDTPIGSFAPKLALRREVTDPDEVRDSDVVLDGVDYIPGKHWDEAIGKWMFDGFSRLANPNTQAVVKITGSDHSLRLSSGKMACTCTSYFVAGVKSVSVVERSVRSLIAT